jgi:hypothetical protein
VVRSWLKAGLQGIFSLIAAWINQHGHIGWFDSSSAIITVQQCAKHRAQALLPLQPVAMTALRIRMHNACGCLHMFVNASL